MEDLDEHAAAAGRHAPKNGQQMLSHLLAIAYHVLEETKYMNLKPPLRPTSKLFAPDAQVPGSPLQSPGGADSPQDDAHADMNGLAAGFAGSHAHPGGPGHPVVIPYSPEEIQDTYTKILMLKNQYIKVSAELMETMKETGNKSTTGQADKDTMAKLIQRRNHLRNEVYEKNLVMKGLIERMRDLQHSIRIMKGGSAYPPNVVMESV